MAEIVNLRRARKAKTKAEAEKHAAENRVRFGRTKGERERLAAEGELAARRVEGHRREIAAPHDEDAFDKS
ncbi:MAG TPA: DUF4169 family protein [Enterovirga sp.]|jgi:hypothetical protein|nr:DUF4169 family protein [Enterovirga sp.]